MSLELFVTRVRIARARTLGRYAFAGVLEAIIKGGPGSGNWGHTSQGRRGKPGGSDPGGGLHLLLGISTLTGSGGLNLPAKYETQARQALAEAIRGIAGQKRALGFSTTGAPPDVLVGEGWHRQLSDELFGWGKHPKPQTLGDQLRILARAEKQLGPDLRAGNISLGMGAARIEMIGVIRRDLIRDRVSKYIEGLEGSKSFRTEVPSHFNPKSLSPAMEWLNKHVRLPEAIQVKVVSMSSLGRRGNRAFAVPPDTIAIKRASGKSTIIHETGHVVEFQSKRIQQIANDFLAHRTQGASTVRLRTMTGQKSYKSDEQAYTDRFYDPYVGKKYRDGHTEVISMGLEGLRNPHQMLRDPGHMGLMLAMMQGRL